jgi:glycosyltransferase involved in cell wall biosynthesis
MRILYVITAAEFGGASLHVLHLMKADVARGDTVGLVCAPEPRLCSEARDLGVEVFPTPCFVRPIRPLRDLRAACAVLRTTCSFKPDFLSAHSTKAGFAARIAGALFRKPVVFTAHSWAFTEGKTALERRVFSAAERLAARWTAKIICVSEHDRRLALQCRVGRRDQLLTVHNGVDPARFTGVEAAHVRRELRLEGKVVLTWVARLSPPKDPLTLLNAFRTLRTDAHLLLVGDGELRACVEEFIAEHRLADTVHAIGEQKAIPELLAASDLFVLSSRWEGLPYTIIEAMMAGLPVVATAVGGIPELVEEGVTGFLVPCGDPQALAERIRNLLDDRSLRRSMGEKGRQKALREFTLDQMLRKTERVYEEVFGGAKRSFE